MTQDTNQNVSDGELVDKTSNSQASASLPDEVPRIDIIVKKETLRLNLREIYQHLNPDKDINKLIMKELTEGAVNCMFKCYQVDQNPDEAIIIRLFNFRMDTSQFSDQKESLQNRDVEFESMCKGSQLGICAKVHARFHNGIVYGFVPGQTLQLEKVHDIELGKLIAVQVARMHTMVIPNQRTIYSTQMERINNEAKENFVKMFEMMQMKIDKSSIEEYNFLPRLLEINSYIVKLENRLIGVSMGEIGFCHNDLNLSNIIYNEETGVVKILDFEWAEMNYTMIDIAVHFTSFAGFFLEDFDTNLLPSQDFQLQWIRHYMQELNRLKNRKMTAEEFDKVCQTLLLKVNVYMQIVKLNYVIRAPIWDFQENPVRSKNEQQIKNPNNVALFCLKALNGYRSDIERTEGLLKQLEAQVA